MTLPTTENLTLVRGDDYSQTFEFSQPVANFTEIYFTMRSDYASASDTDNSTAAFAGTLGDGDFTITGTNTVQLDIGHTDTLALTDTTYFYDIQVLTTLNKIYTTQRGTVLVISDVTR